MAHGVTSMGSVHTTASAGGCSTGVGEVGPSLTSDAASGFARARSPPDERTGRVIPVGGMAASSVAVRHSVGGFALCSIVKDSVCVQLRMSVLGCVKTMTGVYSGRSFSVGCTSYGSTVACPIA